MAEPKDDPDKAHFVHKAWHSSIPWQGPIEIVDKHFLIFLALLTGFEIGTPHADDPES